MLAEGSELRVVGIPATRATRYYNLKDRSKYTKRILVTGWLNFFPEKQVIGPEINPRAYFTDTMIFQKNDQEKLSNFSKSKGPYNNNSKINKLACQEGICGVDFLFIVEQF